MAFTAAHSAALASWRFLSSSFVLNISWTHCRLLPEAAWSHRADILMLKILTTWSAPALASWAQARSSHLPWPARPGLGLQRSLFTVREWLWQWWVVKESHKHCRWFKATQISPRTLYGCLYHPVSLQLCLSKYFQGWIYTCQFQK